MSFESDLKAIEKGEGNVEAFRKKYLQTAKTETDRGFMPAIEPAEALITSIAKSKSWDSIEMMRSGRTSESGFLGWANEVWRKRRRSLLRRSLRNGASYLLAAEGDSWFHYPFGFDCLTHFFETRDIAVSSAAAAGDTLANMSRRNWQDLRGRLVVNNRRVDALLFSGGGNDILFGASGNSFEDMFVNSQTPNAPETYLSNAFYAAADTAMKQINDMLDVVHAEHPDLPIILHGYDTPMARDGKAIGKKFIQAGIVDKSLRQAIVAEMIRHIYRLLRTGPGQRQNVAIADIFNAIEKKKKYWGDEIHPFNEGWGFAYARIYAALRNNFLPDLPYASETAQA